MFKIKKILKSINAHKVLILKKHLCYLYDYKKFKSHAKKSNLNLNIKWKNRYPCLNDNTQETYFDRHDIYHTAWAARILSKYKPKKHTDIGSSLYFPSIASAFIPIDFYDYRPAKLELSNRWRNN